MKLVVWGPGHEVGFRMNGFPVPGAVPNRVMSCELMVVGSPRRVELGMSLITVLRPKSGRLSWTPDCRMIGIERKREGAARGRRADGGRCRSVLAHQIAASGCRARR